jgi:hypothetical protein
MNPIHYSVNDSTEASGDLFSMKGEVTSQQELRISPRCMGSAIELGLCQSQHDGARFLKAATKCIIVL